MTIDDCFQLGYIVKPHGLNGELQLFLDVDSPSEYKNLESVFVLQGQTLVPFFIEYIKVNGAKALVAFDEVHDIEGAKALKGLELYLPLSVLPDLGKSEFYLHEIIGFELVDVSSNQSVGMIESILEAGPQLIMSVNANGTEILIPYQPVLLGEVDREASVLKMRIPDGLLDVYLTEDEN